MKVKSKLLEWGNSNYRSGSSSRSQFQDPGGNSALRRSSSFNPRNQPCPTCKRPNMLTPKDVRMGYQCNDCADRDEGRF